MDNPIAPKEHVPMERVINPRITVLTFVILTFLFSSVFWYLTAIVPPLPENATSLTIYTIAVMWCPAVAAIVTRLWF
jgi:hypothetical protein